MFLLDTSTLLLLRIRNKCFPYAYLTTSIVINELALKSTSIEQSGPCFLIIGFTSKKIRTADEEIYLLKKLCPNLEVITQDYHLRKKTKGTSVKKLLINY